MKKLLSLLQISPVYLGGIFIFAYLESIRGRVTPGQTINWYILTPEAAVGTLIKAILITFILRFTFKRFHGLLEFPIQKGTAFAAFGLGLTAYLLLSNGAAVIISLLFDTWDRNFTDQILLSVNVSYLLDFIVYGGFYLSYLLFQEYKNHQHKLAAYELALSDSRFSQLKQQLNPHFLFNNLNILDQLIEENPKSASRFLQNFAALYRYPLEKSNSKLVGIAEEIEFAKAYFSLMSEKFGESYLMDIDPEIPSGKIPPLTLQLLIENAVLHNFGTLERPVVLSIKMTDKIEVSNNRVPFAKPKHKGGKGLQNLREQYELLADEPIEIIQTEDLFTVILPVIPDNQ
jgi:sensor histidine kinase YesM